MSVFRLWRDRRGGVSVIGAMALSSLLGMGALAVDLNRGYMQNATNQRVANMAALGTAMAFRSNSGISVQSTAEDIVRANGITNANTVATLVNNFPTTGAQSIRVTVTTPVTISLGKVFGAQPSFNVAAMAAASVASPPAASPACFIGLASSGVAVETSGGGTIDTGSCGIAGNGDVKNFGTSMKASSIVSGAGAVLNDYGTMTADAVRYATSFTSPAWNGNVPAASKRSQASVTITDPLSGNADLTSARALLGTFTTVPALTNPNTSSASGAANWIFNYSPDSAVSGFRVGNSKEYRVPAGTYNIGKLEVAGDITVIFQGSSTVTINGGVVNGGAKLQFGDGTYKINGGFVSGSSGVTFGNAAVHIGSGTVTFAGTNRFGNGAVTINAIMNIGGGTKVKMGAGAHAFGGISVGGGSWMLLGAGNLTVAQGIYVGGNSALVAGAGSYLIGRYTSTAGVDSAWDIQINDSIRLAGSGKFFMGDGSFSANGNIRTEGGSYLIFGSTNNHLINGNLVVAGGVLFNPSRYTIGGNFINGTGGTTWPSSFIDDSVSPNVTTSYGSNVRRLNGTTESATGFDQVGVDVTFILSGTLNLGGGARTKLMAPTGTSVGAGIADVLVDSLTSTATTWGAGASNVFVGTVHVPNSHVTMSGGNGTRSAGQCFMLIASRISVTGGAAAASACAAINGVGTGGSSTAQALGLVQ